MMAPMRALLRCCSQTVTVRVLALLLALGVAALPLLPQPRQHVCHLAAAKSPVMSTGMTGDCCCAVTAGAPAHPDRRAPGGSCCQELALDQHQPTALPAPESAGPRVLPPAILIEVLAHSASHDWQFSGAACAAPYPDGPPAYLRWGGFLT
jgi:hypothetical protein